MLLHQRMRLGLRLILGNLEPVLQSTLRRLYVHGNYTVLGTNRLFSHDQSNVPWSDHSGSSDDSVTLHRDLDPRRRRHSKTSWQFYYNWLSFLRSRALPHSCRPVPLSADISKAKSKWVTLWGTVAGTKGIKGQTRVKKKEEALTKAIGGKDKG